MNLQIEQILAAAAFLLWLDIFIVIRTLYNKTHLQLNANRRAQELAELAHLFEANTDWDKKKVRRLFNNYLFLKQSIDLPEKERIQILKLAQADKIEPQLNRQIRSANRYKRMEAALKLALIANDSARLTLQKALLREKDYPVKLFFANALADIKDPRCIDVLVESLLGSHRWYRDKTNMLIASFGMTASDYLRGYLWRTENEIQELLIDVAGQCICEDLRQYLDDFLRRGQEEIGKLTLSIKDCPERSCAYCAYGRNLTEDLHRSCRYHGIVASDYKCSHYRFLVTTKDPAFNHHRLMVKAADTLAHYYPEVLNDAFYLEFSDREIRNIAVKSLANNNKEENVRQLINYLSDDEVSLSARQGLSMILSAHARLIPPVVDEFFTTEDKRLKQQLAEVLAGRIEYFIYKLGGKDRERYESIIREVISLGKFSQIIEFLKINKDIEIENAVLKIIREAIDQNEALAHECGLYLPDRILEKLVIARQVPPVVKRQEKMDWKMVRGLYVILFFALAFSPFLYIVRYSDRIWSIPFIAQLKTFVVDFNYDFAWYSMTVNIIYIILLILSAIQVRTATRLWNLKTMSMLFKPRMLPSVSIVAPAYNEEKTIIESANSLLNLKYPDYELVIVNDGSRDNTLNTLITYYDLKRTEYHFQQRLKTKTVRAIYTNPLLPRLIVVDKENGGKADSLNAGINIASKEYFCGIDADSLLEPDSLLKVAALSLDHGIETPAMGGNVFPINGCEVDRGKLMSIGLAKNNLAKLQTIEYLRAFMCGRLGWAQINSLLIISGAFGLFRRERIIGIGGYLTSSERYQKDTVGEDMELVVRISRLMREKKLKYRIGYAYNANCWTEVPEDMKTLKRQRDRWHRGLIDIIFFHRKVIFNPSYGKMGLLGMPYYLIFEMIGPLFEIQGYIMVGLAAIFGLISTKLALLLFVSSIFMGILISMGSVLIAERQLYYFNYRDTLKMLLIAFIENFGPRQIFSLWRVLGFLNAMKKPTGWGKMERKGFGPAAGAAAKPAQPPAEQKKG